MDFVISRRQMLGLGAAALGSAGLAGCGSSSDNGSSDTTAEEAHSMKYVLQIFAGPWDKANYKAADIIERIKTISAKVPVDRVIIGWNTDASLYKEVGAFLHDQDIRMMLWLPCFSEISGIAEPDETRDIFGKKIITPLKQEGEDFVFCCPSSQRNIEIVESIYEEHFADCGFDGVFLDKIRGQSFVSGVPGVLSCGCERCEKAFKERGVDIADVRKLYEEKGDAFFNMRSYPMSGEFELEEQTAQRFFEAKEEIIADAVTELCDFFKNKGLIVGLDLFAPLVCRFVGQNYSLITKSADFIKPMLYRKTEAPAGIGYEYALFEKYAPAAKKEAKPEMDKAFLDTQLEAVGQVSCEKYPGIEINYLEDIARTDANYVRESLSAVKEVGFEGAALCWNMMEAPDAHIDAVAELQ